MEIINAESAVVLREPTAVALGTFDGVHRGHAALIRAAQSTGLHTVVATFSRHPSAILRESSVKTLMSPQLKERVFEQLGVDTLVYLDFEKVRGMSGPDFLRKVVIGRLHAQKVICGFNYRFGRNASSGAQDLAAICAENGAEGICIDPVCMDGAPVSSTRIRGLVEEGRLEEADNLLGRPFAFCLEVVNGRRLGRKLGMPTINQVIPEGHIVPRYGVYASVTEVNGRLYASVTSIGVKPTVGSAPLGVETYIIGFHGDLYGQCVEVRLLAFLRPEIRFENLDVLKTQMAKDSLTAARIAEDYLDTGRIAAE